MLPFVNRPLESTLQAVGIIAFAVAVCNHMFLGYHNLRPIRARAKWNLRRAKYMVLSDIH